MASGATRKISAKSRLGEKLAYIHNHWDGLQTFLTDGRVEIDSNRVENLIRPIALNRKNSLFAGHDEGGAALGRVASLIETCKINGVEPFAYAQQFIDPPEKTRSSILTSIQNMVECLSSPAAQRGFGMGARGRKVDLAALKEGRPMTIYLTVPPAYLSSHASLLRLWLGTALAAVQRRKVIPARPTLFMVDEAAQLGRLDALLTAATLMRGYGLRVWSFWQSIAQMERIYGPALQEFLDNAGTVSMFGIANGASAARAAQLTGWTGDLMGLPRHAQVIAQAGSAPQIVRRVDYRKDPRFRGMFDPNPFHKARQVIREVA